MLLAALHLCEILRTPLVSPQMTFVHVQGSLIRLLRYRAVSVRFR